MPMSVQMNAAYNKMMEWGKKLTAYDFGDTCVRIVHEEGSTFFLENAFIVDPDDDYIWIFTEHQGYLVFHKDELLGWSTLACVPDHSLNYLSRSCNGFPEQPRLPEEIIAEQMPDYEIVESDGDDHENIQVFYLNPKDSDGNKPITVAVSCIQGRIIGRQS